MCGDGWDNTEWPTIQVESWTEGGGRKEHVRATCFTFDREVVDKRREFIDSRPTVQKTLRKFFRWKENETRYLELGKEIMGARNELNIKFFLIFYFFKG